MLLINKLVFSRMDVNGQKLKNSEIHFTDFSLCFAPTTPVVAQSGGMICTTGKTEINCDLKTAGGCGVVPFSSLPPLFRGRQ
ncbi:hypothetical protein QQ16_03200 [Salmonella enterica]|nr:hypothetical protein [Salmonella enterica]